MFIPNLPRQANWVLGSLAKFPTEKTKLFVVTGNHDSGFGDYEIEEGLWLQAARRPGVYVDGDTVQYAGHRFVCRPWTAPLDPPPATEGPVVLLAHAPPDGTPLSTVLGWPSGGDFETRQTAEALPPGSIVLSGHVHSPDGFFSQVSNSVCFNAGMGEDGDVPNHIRINTSTKQAWLIVKNEVARYAAWGSIP
jgi:Icc-related predicted phosphoesterase